MPPHFRPALLVLAVAHAVTSPVRAEVVFAADFSDYEQGPLEGQQGWTVKGEGPVDGPSGASVMSGKVFLSGEDETRVLSPELPGHNALYYGFDVTVNKAPAGRKRVIAGLRAGEWTRGEVMLMASQTKTDGTFTAHLGVLPPGEQATFDFDLGATYRCVVAVAAAGAKLWFAEKPVKEQPHAESDRPLKGPFTGFYLRPQPGEVEIANLVVATSFEEAADPGAAAGRSGAGGETR